MDDRELDSTVVFTGDDDIPEIDTETFSSDDMLAQAEKESEALDTYPSEPEEVETEEPEDIEEEEEVEEVEEVEETKQEKPEKPEKIDDKQNVYVDDIFKKESGNTVYKEAQSELKMIQKELDLLELDSQPPERPADDLDDEAMRKYEVRLALWEDRQHQVNKQGQRLSEKARQVAKMAENAFRKDFEGKDLKDFETWVRNKRQILSFVSGDVSLYELYTLYSAQNRKLVTMENVKKITKEKAKVKPINVKSTTGRSNAGNGLPPKYKHANNPMFKGYVADLKKRGSDLQGNKFTNEYIEELCAQEYQVLKEGHAL